ncbi:hypothetical protein LguiB_026383 [Lonicera macranthoides]
MIECLENCLESTSVKEAITDGTFDAVVDKEGLDALMEPEVGPKLGSRYLSDARGLFEALDIENRIPTEHASGSDLLFFYKAVLLDALQQSSSFLYSCGVFLVPNKDLSPLVKHLAPGKNESGAQIPFMLAGDGIKQRKVVHQVSSALTGPIIVDDVVYEKVDDDLVSLFPSKELVFRCLTFQRSEGLGQSEALLTREGCQNVASGKEQKTHSSSKSSKKKGNQTRNDSLVFVTNGKDYSFLCSFSSDVHAYLFFGFLVVIIYE